MYYSKLIIYKHIYIIYDTLYLFYNLYLTITEIPAKKSIVYFPMPLGLSNFIVAVKNGVLWITLELVDKLHIAIASTI